LHRLADRFPSRVIVWPVLVQGQGAAEQVSGAVRGFSAMPEGHPDRPDLVIIARGGGSIEDLWSFNEEVVVRAIAGCSIPTISAVGHETDTTLADFAADRRAPTPTAAAEIAVPVRAELAAMLSDFGARKERAILRPVQLGRERLETRVQRLPAPQALLQPQAQKLDDLAMRLANGLRERANRAREQLQSDRARLNAPLLKARAEKAQDRLAAIARLMISLDPDNVLRRGYVRVIGPDGRTLTDKAEAAKEAALTLKFRDGDLPVGTGSSTSPAPRKPRPSGTPPRQDDLFG